MTAVTPSKHSNRNHASHKSFPSERMCLGSFIEINQVYQNIYEVITAVHFVTL